MTVRRTVLVLSASVPEAAWPAVEAALDDPHATAWMLCHDLLRWRGPDKVRQRVTCLDDLLTGEDFARINHLATRWADSWHRGAAPAEELAYRGVDVGDVVLYPAFNFAGALLRLDALVQRMLDHTGATELRIFATPQARFPLLVREESPFLESVAAATARSRGVRVVECGRAAGLLALGGARARAEMLRRLRHLRRLGYVARARGTRAWRSRPGRPAGSAAPGPVVGFVRSSHSILETADAFCEMGLGRAVYFGLGDEYDRKYRGRADRVPFADLYGAMSVVAPRSHARFLRRLDAALRADRTDAEQVFAETPYLRGLLAESLREQFATEGPWILRYIDAADALLTASGAEVLYADNSHQPIERAFLRLGRRRGLLTIETAHCIWNDLFELGFPPYLITDHFFVWGAHDRRLMERLGSRPGEVDEAGTGRLARYFERPKRAPRGDGRIRVGVTCEREVKFYGVTGYSNLLEQTHLRRYGALVELARRNRAIQLSFKLRAGIEADFYLFAMLARAGITDYEVVRDGDIAAWLPSLDLLVTDYSTLGLEAMMFDVPVLVHRNDALGDSVGFESSGAVDVVDPDMSNLAELVERVARCPEARARERAEFVAAAVGPSDARWHRERSARLIAAKYAAAKHAAAKAP